MPSSLFVIRLKGYIFHLFFDHGRVPPSFGPRCQEHCAMVLKVGRILDGTNREDVVAILGRTACIYSIRKTHAFEIKRKNMQIRFSALLDPGLECHMNVPPEMGWELYAVQILRSYAWNCHF